MSEILAIRAAAVLIVVATMFMALAVQRGRRDSRLALLALGLAVVLFALGIAWRWQRLGHGPFLNMFEILLSNCFSLSAVLLAACLSSRAVRASAIMAMPVLWLLIGWLLYVPARDTVLPPTYETPILWFHVAASKVFLGLCLIALALAALIVGRRHWLALRAATRGLTDRELDLAAWRFLGMAVAAQTLLLVAGAWWAQDAWGRYWAWDPLETWAFVTWLAAAAALHARLAYKLQPRHALLFVGAVFVLAFWTFFGVPFVSTAPHKGAV